MSGEPCREDEVLVRQPDHLGGLPSWVSLAPGLNRTGSGVDQPEPLVLAGGRQAGPRPVPAQAVHGVSVAEDGGDGHPLLHVPHHHHVVVARTGQDVVSRGVPLHQPHLPPVYDSCESCDSLYDSLPVASECDETLRHLQHALPVRHVPHPHAAVLAAAGDDVVIEGVPLDVQHGPAVPPHPGTPVELRPARPEVVKLSSCHAVTAAIIPVEGHHQEAAPAPHLLHRRQKLGVDSAEGGVMGITSELDVVITFLFLSRNSINVTKFRTSHTSEAGSCSRFLTLASVQHFVSLSRGSVRDNERYLSQHVTESVTVTDA